MFPNIFVSAAFLPDVERGEIQAEDPTLSKINDQITNKPLCWFQRLTNFLRDAPEFPLRSDHFPSKSVFVEFFFQFRENGFDADKCQTAFQGARHGNNIARSNRAERRRLSVVSTVTNGFPSRSPPDQKPILTSRANISSAENHSSIRKRFADRIVKNVFQIPDQTDGFVKRCRFLLFDKRRAPELLQISIDNRNVVLPQWLRPDH